MELKTFDAAQAYGAALGRAGAPGMAAADSVVRGSAFGSLVESLVADTTNAVAAAETQSIKAVAGEADLVDVVTTISNAEMMLETVTTVRDRVISAYQDIMRMPI